MFYKMSNFNGFVFVLAVTADISCWCSTACAEYGNWVVFLKKTDYDSVFPWMQCTNIHQPGSDLTFCFYVSMRVTYLVSLESTAIAAMLSPNGGDGMIAPGMCSTMTSQCVEEYTKEFTRNKLKLCSPVIHAKSGTKLRQQENVLYVLLKEPVTSVEILCVTFVELK